VKRLLDRNLLEVDHLHHFGLHGPLSPLLPLLFILELVDVPLLSVLVLLALIARLHVPILLLVVDIRRLGLAQARVPEAGLVLSEDVLRAVPVHLPQHLVDHVEVAGDDERFDVLHDLDADRSVEVHERVPVVELPSRGDRLLEARELVARWDAVPEVLYLETMRKLENKLPFPRPWPDSG
jgi:hypothetical protein